MAKLLIRVDGSCIPNPGNMAIGIVIYRDGELWKKINELIGVGTNNIAEYCAVIRGLEEIKDLSADSIEFYCDSQLVVKQLNGQFKVKNKKIIPLYEKTQELVKKIKAPIFFIWNRRENNQLADQLARKLLVKEEQNKRALASKDLRVEDAGEHFLVKNKKNSKVYHINLSVPECDCYDFEHNCRKWNLECKHLVAVREYLKGEESQITERDYRKMKIIIFSKMVSQKQWVELLNRYNQEEQLPLEFIFPERDSKLTSDQLASAEVIIGGELSESELDMAKSLKLFQIPFTGVDQQNMNVFKRFPQINVCNTHGNSSAVAELAFCLLLALAKNLIYSDRELRKGEWHGYTTQEPTIQLAGRSLGIIGLGAIGLEISQRAISFGMKVYAVKRTLKKEEDLQKKYNLTFLGTMEQLEYVISQSDFIVVTLPLTAKTEDVIGGSMLKLMKGKYLVNVGRGKVINEEALYRYLKNGTLAGAGIDTWYQYPNRDFPQRLPSKFAFQELSNVVMSPHSAGYTDKAVEENVLEVYKNIKRIFEGEEPENKINLEEGY